MAVVSLVNIYLCTQPSTTQQTLAHKQYTSTILIRPKQRSYTDTHIQATVRMPKAQCCKGSHGLDLTQHVKKNVAIKARHQKCLVHVYIQQTNY